MSQGLLPNSLVSVNGVSLGSGACAGKMRLQFGDIVTIGTNKGDRGEEWEAADFVFMVGSSSICN